MASAAERLTSEFPPRRQALLFGSVAVLLTIIGLAVIGFLLLQRTGGALFFTLDDPYIHLSLAENILRGHYGINTEAYAAPSSSILYPFLLSALLALRLGDGAALVLNVVPMLGTAWLLGLLLARLELRPTWLPLLALPPLLLTINAIALPFTGMEHGLHVFVSVLIIYGLSRVFDGQGSAWWLLVAIVAAPLLRFEGFALALAAILALLVWQQVGAAVLSAILIGLATLSYVLAMQSLGLPPLPSSVMVKSNTSALAVEARGYDVLISILAKITFALSIPSARVLLVGLLLACLAAALAPSRPGQKTMLFVLLMAGMGHLAAGDFGWFARYEIYALAMLSAGLLWLYAPILSHRPAWLTGIVILALIAPAALHINQIRATPTAAQNVRDQQWQMHLFAVEHFPERVAVNDLGWVSYRNDTFVLDLWGLGSEEARQMERTAENIAALTARSDVVFAMLYESWFEGAIPADWCRIARLQTIQVSSASGEVTFFLLQPEREDDMRTALAAWSADLLLQTELETFPCG